MFDHDMMLGWAWAPTVPENVPSPREEVQSLLADESIVRRAARQQAHLNY